MGDREVMATLGRSVVVRGEIRGSEDLTVDGQVEGNIHLPDAALTIGPQGQIQADVVARVVTVFGSITGRITASHRVEIRKGSSAQGDLLCACVVIQEGAYFCGKVDMGSRSET